MQAYEGYLENGRFFPLGNQDITGRQRVIVTVLGEEKNAMTRQQAMAILLEELEKGRKSAEEHGWLTADEVDALLFDENFDST